MRQVELYGRARSFRDKSRICLSYDRDPSNNDPKVTLCLPDTSKGVSDTEAIVRALDGPDILVFNYAPNLRIVGTYHALNESDKAVFRELIAESDFVACEYDEWRLRGDGSGKVAIDLWRRGYDPSEAIFYASPFDYIYLKLLCDSFIDAIDYSNSKTNESLVEGGNEKRSREENEFKFCISVAKDLLGKNVYLVDPAYMLFADFLKLDPIMKLRHLAYYKTSSRWPNPVREVFMARRESRMIDGIEKVEGPIEDLKRVGTLFVGHDHAVNYLVKVLNEQLTEQ